MKKQAKTAFVIGLLLFALLSLSCGLGSTFVPTPTPTSSPTSTNTPTPIPTATATATVTFTPTPLPAVFENRPSYLETAFSSTGWVWKDFSTGGRIANRPHDSRTLITLAYDSDTIFVGGIWNKDTGDFQFVDDFFPIALQDFLRPETAEKIIEFKDENKNKPPERYKATIDGFDILLSIVENPEKNTRTLLISITEEQSYR